ncbi:hypothetical protein ABK040_000840 [Willaertia magna]
MLTSDQEEEEIPPLSSSTKKSTTTTRKKKSNNNSTNTTATTTTDSNNNNSTTTTTTVSSSNNNTKKSTRKKRETTTSESRNKKISIPLQWGNSQLHFSQPSSLSSINNNNINSFNNNTNIQHPLYNSINITVLSRKIKDIEEINIPNNILFRTHQYDFKLKPKQSFFDWTGTTSGFYARIKLLFNKNLKNNNLDNTNNSDNHLEDDEDEWIEYKYEKNPMIIQTFQEDYNDKSFLIVLEWRSDTGCTFNKHLYKFELEIFRTINDNNNLKCIYRIKSSSFSILSKPEVYLKRLKKENKRNNNTNIQNSNENKKKKRNDDIIVIDENDNNTINVNNGMNEMEGLTSTTTFVPSSPVLFTNSSSLIYKNNQIINNLQQEIIMNNNSGTVSPFLCSSPELNLSQSTNTHLLLNNNNLNNNITNNNSINNNNNNINSNITDNFISFTPPNLSQGSFINYTPNTPNSNNNNNGNVTDNVISLSFLEENYGTEIKLSQTSNTSEKSTLLNSSFQMYFNEEGRREDDFTFKAFHNFQQEEEKESDSFFNK